MKINHSYNARILHEFKVFRNTIKIFRSAVKFLIGVVLEHYEELSDLSNNEAQRHIETLVHSTSSHSASYPSFDKKFYKMPIYFRRNAISTAIATVKSHKELLALWEKTGQGKKPKLNTNQNWMPVFFRGNTFNTLTDDTVEIKLYINHDWVWKTLCLNKSDVKYLSKYDNLSAPKLKQIGHRYALVFTVETITSLTKEFNTICSVDLGINHDAVCTVMRKDGTVIGREFINHPIEKDHLYRIIDQIKKRQEDGIKRNKRLWSFANNYNRELSIQTSREITEFAKANGVDVIVFEHLGTKGKKKGSKKQRLHLWKAKDVQRRVEDLAHRCGMRIARVCAYNTSKLAFDGSGEVVRDKENHSLCTFKSGKQYNCDLSASYNIGARYFIRNMMNSLSEDIKLDIEAKVPQCAKRTQCTLSTLINLCAVFKDLSLNY